MKVETKGIVYGIVAAALYGLFPVLVNQGTKSIPPIAFIGIVTLLGGLTGLVYVLIKGNLKELLNRKAWKPMLLVTLFIVIIPWLLISVGSSMTTGVNTSLLLLIEIVYTVIFTHFIGEKTTALKLLGAGGVMLGSALIVYNGNFSLNTGDFIILLAPLTFPFGNFYSKKALNHVSPEIIVLVRFLLGGLFFIAISQVFETGVRYGEVISNYWPLILFLGIVIIGIRTIIAYESLKRLDISKFIFLALIFPFFSLIALVLFFEETVSAYQGIGFAIMMTGVYFAIKRKSVDIKKTKYAA